MNIEFLVIENAGKFYNVNIWWNAFYTVIMDSPTLERDNLLNIAFYYNMFDLAI